jgi:DNA-binding MarR family transcriptional regulator
VNRAVEPNDLLIAFLETQIVLERASENFFQPYGITGAQYNILNLLAYNGNEMEQNELTQRLVVGKSSISIVLRRMAEHGLVTREKHASDKRQSVLQLTVAGRALWEQIRGKYEEKIERIFGVVPAKHRTVVVQALQAVRAALEG